jgi:hypothetical protein
MKIKIAILTLLCACSAQATLKDVAEWSTEAAPDAFYKFIFGENITHQFFDEARVIAPDHGWVSRFGVLNGGTYFHTNLFDLDPTQVAQVSWDFSNLPGYSMSWLLLFGRDENGVPWQHLYSVPHKFRFTDTTEVVLHEGTDIWSIAFYGRTPTLPVPETGSTLMLFILGLAILARIYEPRKT